MASRILNAGRHVKSVVDRKLSPIIRGYSVLGRGTNTYSKLAQSQGSCRCLSATVEAITSETSKGGFTLDDAVFVADSKQAASRKISQPATTLSKDPLLIIKSLEKGTHNFVNILCTSTSSRYFAVFDDAPEAVQHRLVEVFLEKAGPGGLGKVARSVQGIYFLRKDYVYNNPQILKKIVSTLIEFCTMPDNESSSHSNLFGVLKTSSGSQFFVNLLHTCDEEDKGNLISLLRPEFLQICTSEYGHTVAILALDTAPSGSDRQRLISEMRGNWVNLLQSHWGRMVVPIAFDWANTKNKQYFRLELDILRTAAAKLPPMIPDNESKFFKIRK